MADIILVIPPNNFREEEVYETKEILTDFGHDVQTASLQEGICVGERGNAMEAEMAISDVAIDDFEGIVFIGESGASVFFHDHNALQLAIDARKKQKLIGGIGFGPVILANSGILDGLHATVDRSKIEDIEDQGAIYSGEQVTVDDRVITGSSVGATREFARTLSKFLLLEDQKAY
jgi:protease I